MAYKSPALVKAKKQIAELEKINKSLDESVGYWMKAADKEKAVSDEMRRAADREDLKFRALINHVQIINGIVAVKPVNSYNKIAGYSEAILRSHEAFFSGIESL